MNHRLVSRHVGVGGRVAAWAVSIRCLSGVGLTIALLLGLDITPAIAQAGQLSGYVTDESAAVVDAAVVVVTNTETGRVREVRTDAAGRYVVATLDNGRYTVRVSASGFAPVTRAILVDVAQAARLDVRLAIGGLAEAVTVSTEARPVQSTDGAVSTVIDRRFIGALPLNGRTLQSLISLVPGVVAVSAGSGSAGQFSVNGQRADTNAFSIDGVSANVAAGGGGFGEDYGGNHPGVSVAGTTSNLVSLDALQEFRIQTSSFAPEYGRTPGAQVQLITRSGANTFTGAGSYYFRHDAMDAGDWFANRASLPKAKLRHHDVGGVFGGPLRRDRMFYFVSHESLSQSLPQATTGVVPSLHARAIAAEALRGMLNAYPVPNGPDVLDPTTGLPNGLARFTSNHSDSTRVHATGARLDGTLTPRWTAFTRVQYAPSDALRRQGVTSWVRSTEQATLTATGGLNATLGAKTALDVRANFSRSTSEVLDDVDDWGGAGPVNRSYLFPPTAGNSLGDFIVFIGSNRPRLIVGPTQENTQRQINVVATASHVRGAHLLKAGVDYRRLVPDFSATPYQLQTFVRSLSDIAAGQVYLFKSVRQNVQPIFENLSLFAQDTWAVNNRLTLTYGLRWDVNPAFEMAKGQYPLTLGTTTAPSEFALAPVGTRLYDTEYTNLAPRLGFSVKLNDRDSWGTVIKGGGGIFFDTASQAVSFVGHPNAILEVSGPVSVPLTASAAAILVVPTDYDVPPISGTVDAYSSEFATPRAWQWNVGVVQDLASGQSISLTYVGSAGRHLLRRQSFLAPNADFQGTVTIALSDADSSYHALSAQFTRRMSRGLQALASYTWSHAIDETSAVVTEYIERGSASFDVRHSGSVALAYEVPSPANGGVRRALLSGWAFDGTARWRSALPVDVFAGLDYIDGEVAPIRPDLISGVPFYVEDEAAPGGRRFNTAPNPDREGCVGPVCSAADGKGNIGRNIFRGLGAWQVDVALRRSVRLIGASRLTISAEVFNVLNRPNFGEPSGTVDTASYGQPVSMLNRSLGGLDPLYQIGGPRSIQLGARVAF